MNSVISGVSLLRLFRFKFFHQFLSQQIVFHVLTLFLILFTSCSTLKRVPTQSTDIPSRSHLQYMLPLAPHWAALMSPSQCRLESGIRLLNFETLHRDFQLNYFQMTHLQLLVHQEWSKRFSHELIGDESVWFEIFYQSYQRMKSRDFAFLMPRYPKLLIVFADEIKNKDYLKILQSSEQRMPVIISRCMSAKSLEQKVLSVIKSSVAWRYVGQEAFTLFHDEKNFSLGHHYKFLFETFFKNYDIALYQPTNQIKERGKKR